uniref:C-type lectin domain-containing protein n=1 Tax=Panagrolaimus superbus TaxID=310955 RepID=A0A914YEX3_9BILA
MFLLKIFLSFSIFLFIKIEGTPTPAVCKEKAICEWSWIPKKLCGTWYCYGVYSPVKPAWRNFWGVTNVCKSWWKGSHGISIHCQEENDWARKGFGPFYTGLYIPENLPWNVSNFQWTDGSPVDFVDWAKPGQGTNVQQPNNGAPPGQVERVVINSNHWHDVVADPGVVAIPCKKLPVRVERTFLSHNNNPCSGNSCTTCNGNNSNGRYSIYNCAVHS